MCVNLKTMHEKGVERLNNIIYNILFTIKALLLCFSLNKFMLTRPIRNKALLIKKYKFIFSLTLILYTKAAPAFF